METKTVLITGATSGIGKATAYRLAESKMQLIICGRRREELDKIIEDLSKLTSATSLCFDVSDNQQVTTAIESLPEDFQNIDILINNAGNAHGLDKIQDGNIDDWDKMIDSNVKGVLYVAKAVIPRMVEKSSGHIINIGSLAGREIYEKGNVYCASKHAVNAISKGMRIDLNKHNIKVSEINPGLVETEFSKVRFKGDAIADTIYKGYKALEADDIAEIIEFVISRPHHVNMADVLILPQDQATSSVINKR
ncbi:MAG: SDR family NAD(P)-dependent oxidoreductase [Bacteroidota bacterium]|nr:SDR family NAD(P)-dependent oxidoreductase [Bacteroidota bacterium]